MSTPPSPQLPFADHEPTEGSCHVTNNVDDDDDTGDDDDNNGDDDDNNGDDDDDNGDDDNDNDNDNGDDDNDDDRAPRPNPWRRRRTATATSPASARGEHKAQHGTAGPSPPSRPLAPVYATIMYQY